MYLESSKLPWLFYLNASALYIIHRGHRRHIFSIFVDLITISCGLLKQAKMSVISWHMFAFLLKFYLNHSFCMQKSSRSRPQTRTSHSHVGTPSRPSIQPYNLPDAGNCWLLWQQQRKEGLYFFPPQFWQQGCTHGCTRHCHVMVLPALIRIKKTTLALQPMDSDLRWCRLWLVTENHSIIKWRVFIVKCSWTSSDKLAEINAKHHKFKLRKKQRTGRAELMHLDKLTGSLFANTAHADACKCINGCKHKPASPKVNAFSEMSL